jgi:hypothetical protein
LTEPNAPVIFALKDVPADAHPQGIAVVFAHPRGSAGAKRHRDRFGDFPEGLFQEDQ